MPDGGGLSLSGSATRRSKVQTKQAHNPREANARICAEPAPAALLLLSLSLSGSD